VTALKVVAEQRSTPRGTWVWRVRQSFVLWVGTGAVRGVGASIGFGAATATAHT
jgi:hypothetical protein